MSAREELHESMCGSCCGRFARGECKSVDRLIDAYAHELAELIRDAHVGDHPDHGWVEDPFDAADLIDPEAT